MINIDEIREKAKKVGVKVIDIDGDFVEYESGVRHLRGKTSYDNFMKFIDRLHLEKRKRFLEQKRRSVYYSLPQSLQEFNEIEAELAGINKKLEQIRGSKK